MSRLCVRSGATVLLAVILLTGMTGGTVASTFDVSISVPGSATVEEPVSIGGEVTVPDQPGEYETDVVVRLEIDGEEVDRKTVTVRDGETTSVSFSHTFQNDGDHTIRIIGETSFAGYTYSDEASTTITIEAPDVETPAVTTEEFTGAAVPVPASIRDDVDAYRNQAGNVGGDAFVLLTESNAYIVFTTGDTILGRAVVRGQVVESNAIQLSGLQLGVIAASDARDVTDITSTTVAELQSNPDRRAREVVRVTDTHQQTAVLTDDDIGGGITAPQTVGVLGGTPSDAFFDGVVDEAARVSDDAEEVRERLSAQDGVPTVGFEEGYWLEAEQTVTAIVFPPDGPGQAYVDAVGNVTVSGDRPVLYKIDATFDSTQVDIHAVADSPTEYEGEIITLEGDMAFAHVSAQETVHHSTVCGADMVPVVDACVPLLHDVLLSGGAGWSENVGSTVAIVAASNRHQDSPIRAATGHYSMTGEVRTIPLTEEADAQPIFVVYQLERSGDALSNAPEVATNRRDQLEEQLSTGFVSRYDVAATTDADAGGQTTTNQDGQGGEQTSEPGAPAGEPTGDDGSGFGVGVAVVSVVVVLLVRSGIVR